MMLKRILVLAVVGAVAVSGLGVMVARAADDAPPAVSMAQTEEKGWLGVSIVDADEGVVVQAVTPGSPADEAGLRRGDVIEAVDDTAIETAEQLIDVVGSYGAGDTITLTISWRGESREVSVTLGEWPETIGPGMGPGPGGYFHMTMFGVELELVDEGLLIKSIDADSPLAEAGFQEGDVITAINGEPIDMPMAGLFGGMLFDDTDEVVFTVLRDGEEIEIAVNQDDLIPALGGVMTFGGPRPMQLGVTFQNIDADLAAENDLPVEEGALIVEVVEDSPAADAGLQEGDIIVAVDDDAVDAEHTLRDRLYAYEEGDVVTLTVLRDGEEITLDVTLGPRAPEMFGFGGPMDHGFFFGGPDDVPPMMPGGPEMGPEQSRRFEFGGRLGDFMSQHPLLKRFFGQRDDGMFDFNFDFGDLNQRPVPGGRIAPVAPSTSA